MDTVNHVKILTDAPLTFNWTGVASNSSSQMWIRGELAYTNYVLNPSAETSLNAWSASTFEIGRVQDPLQIWKRGNYTVRMESFGLDPLEYLQVQAANIPAGITSVTVGFGYQTAAISTGQLVRLTYTAGGVTQSQTKEVPFAPDGVGWWETTFLVPSGVKSNVSLQFETSYVSGNPQPPPLYTFWMDGVVIRESGDIPQNFFDGSSPDGTGLEVLYVLDATDYSVEIDATPLDSASSVGAVGSFSATVVKPQSPTHPLNALPPEALLRFRIEVSPSTEWGSLTGNVTSVSEAGEGYLLQIDAASDLANLNSYNVQAQPQSGKPLWQIIQYYLTLGGDLPEGVSITFTPGQSLQQVVSVPGWSGELWFHLKQLCAAFEVELVFKDKEILVRPSRSFAVEDTPHILTNHVTRGQNTSGTSLARYVEVYQYNSAPIQAGEIVYPPGGWSEDVEVLSVPAGEYLEQTLDLSASLSSLQAPVMVTSVGRDEPAALAQRISRYTIVGDDDFPIQPAQWTASGGLIEFEIGEDTRTIIVKMRGATGIFMDDGRECQNFSLALSSGNRYSTLRIYGQGVSFNRELFRVPTGVDERLTGTEVGVTIDNTFISSRDQSMSAAVRAAVPFSGYNPQVTGSFAENFGEIWPTDRINRDGRPYRVISTSNSPGMIDWVGEDDLRILDIQEKIDGLTYAQVQSQISGLDYFKLGIKGANFG